MRFHDSEEPVLGGAPGFREIPLNLSIIHLNYVVHMRAYPTTAKLGKLKNVLFALRRFFRKIRMRGETVFDSLLLWFCLHFFHRSFTAHWNTCRLASTRLINDHYEPALLAFVLRALLCHPPSPPRQFSLRKSRVTLGYKTIYQASCFGKDRNKLVCQLG